MTDINSMKKPDLVRHVKALQGKVASHRDISKQRASHGHSIVSELQYIRSALEDIASAIEGIGDD